MHPNEDEKKTAIVIPPEKLTPDALNGLIEEFILREGTDYGTKEYSLEEKKSQVSKQLQSKKIVILFDAALESTTLITLDELKKRPEQNYQILNLP